MGLENLNLPAILAAGVAAVVSLLAMARGKQNARLEARQGQLESKIKQLRLSLHLTREENETLRVSEQENARIITIFVVTLPGLIRQLTATREKRNVAPLLKRLLNVVLEPEQICIFFRSSVANTYKLAASKGLPESANLDKIEISEGEGAVGSVARLQTTMAISEIRRPRVTASSDLSSLLDGDFLAPLLDPDDQNTLGVVTVGGAMKHQASAKALLKMVADLGSVALKNAHYYRKLRMAANQDGLTGLYSKEYGTRLLSLAINDAEQRDRELSILFFDLDHFKKYNDTYGHLAGDNALRRVGQIVQEGIRDDDFAIRFGGEEFLLVLPDADKKGALIAAEKLRVLIEECEFPLAATQPGGRLTISGGIASLRTDSRMSTELIRMADEALYEAKGTGRNRIITFRASYIGGDSEQLDRLRE